jgi:hypothetical protein
VINNREVLRQVRRAIDVLKGKAVEEARKAATSAALTEARLVRVTFTPLTATLIDVIVADRIKEITTIFGDAADQVSRAARVLTATSGDVSRLADQVAATLGSSRAQALSAIDSVAMASARQVTLIDAESAAVGTGTSIVYAYGGPIDSITRPFCLAHATSVTRQVYTLDSLNSLDNGAGQPKPVSVYLGGYKCRHNLQPMTRAEATRQGYRVVE